MEMSGEQRIALPQQKVWYALNDPEILKACIPGCDSIEKVSDAEYKVGMTAAVGLPTLRLVRTAIGGLTLGALAPGEWREVPASRLRRQA